MTNSDSTTRRVIALQDFHIPLARAYTVNLSSTVQDAVEVMDQHNIDQVPVVDADFDGAMVVTRRMVAMVQLTARTDTPVGVVLSEHSNDPKQRTRATTPLTEAAALLIEYDWVLTTDRDGNPVGLATVGDALRALLKG